MNKIVFAALAAVVTGWAWTAPVRSLDPKPQSEDPNHWWAKRFAEKQELVKKGGSDVVFIGDSITHGLENSAVWKSYLAGAPYHALNLGFSGDRTEHVLWRLDHGELDGYQAKVIVLMIGTNNTGAFDRHRETPVDTIVGINAIIRMIQQKQPEAKIILHPILPRGEKPTDERRVRNEIVNTALRQLADEERVFLCDFNNFLVEPDGTLRKELMPDFLHPSAKGQDIWIKAVLPLVNRLLNDKELSRPRSARAIARRMSLYVDMMTVRRHQTMDQQGDSFDVVFLGDSITRGWEGVEGRKVYAELQKDYSILNLGFTGDRTEHLIWRLQNGELDGYKTKLFMLMIGTNNYVEDSPEDVAAGIKRIVDLCLTKHPEAKMLLLPIFPRNDNARNNRRVKNDKTNAIIKGYVDGKRVLWCDFTDKFIKPGPDGFLSSAIRPDLLHLTPEGYRIWAAAVRPYFDQVKKER